MRYGARTLLLALAAGIAIYLLVFVLLRSLLRAVPLNVAAVLVIAVILLYPAALIARYTSARRRYRRSRR